MKNTLPNRLLPATLLVSTLCLTLSLSRAADPKIEEDMRRLKFAYQAAADRALQPLQEKYIFELKRMMEQATRLGKLEDALDIKKEIDGVVVRTDGMRELEQQVLGTTWKWNDDRSFTFKPDGSTPGMDFKYKVTSATTMDFSFGNGDHGVIVFERGMKNAEIRVDRSPKKYETMPMTRQKQ